MFQLADDPIFIAVPNQTRVVVMFTSSTLRMEKEQFAFSFPSLVADVGGVMGLFIGFSFISCGEVLCVWMGTFYRKLNQI